MYCIDSFLWKDGSYVIKFLYAIDVQDRVPQIVDCLWCFCTRSPPSSFTTVLEYIGIRESRLMSSDFGRVNEP